jgi:hypothetical protein
MAPSAWTASWCCPKRSRCCSKGIIMKVADGVDELLAKVKAN